MSESFSALLRDFRLQAGLTQEELAARAGLSARTVSDLERGVHAAPFRHTVGVLARSLQLTPEQADALESSIVRMRVARSAGGPELAAAAVPQPLTPIVGREGEIELCRDLLLRDRVRLLTFTGVGGVGKSRLALEIAHQLSREERQVALVNVDELDDDREVMPAIASSLGLTVRAAVSSRDVIASRFASDSTVLVLDNFDHRLDARLQLLDLLERTPGLQVLATARGPLRLRGEHTMLIEPLELPQETVDAGLEGIEASAAVRMFVAAAQRRAPEFKLTAETAPTIAQIVEKLDGLPLALDLASAQAAVLTPRELLAEIERGAALLHRLPFDLTARRQSLREAFLWSYAQLTPEQQQLLRLCCEFSGIWTADDLLARRREPAGYPGALELLGPLVRCGFVQRIQTPGGESGFRVLGLVCRCVIEEFPDDG